MTSPKHQQIVALWNEGWSATKIGDHLSITKNSVIGIIKRLREHGVELRTAPPTVSNNPPPKSKAQPRRRPKRMAPTVATLPKLMEQRMETISVPIPESEPEPLPDEVTGVHLLDLTNSQCRFPTQTYQGTHYFCGEPRRDPGTSYCAQHHGIVWHKRVKVTKAEALEARRERIRNHNPDSHGRHGNGRFFYGAGT